MAAASIYDNSILILKISIQSSISHNINKSSKIAGEEFLDDLSELCGWGDGMCSRLEGGGKI
jgi:hypothetical protein